MSISVKLQQRALVFMKKIIPGIRSFLLMLLFISCREDYQPPWKNETLQVSSCENLLSYTEDFFDETWYRNRVSVINNATLDPNGNPNADLIDFSYDPQKSRVYQHIYNLEPGTYSFSIFLKAVGVTKSTHAIGIRFDGNESSWNKKIVQINDSNWTRGEVRIKTRIPGTVTVYPAYALIRGGESKRIYAWGAQLIKLDTLSSHKPTYCGKDVILGNR